MAISMSLCSDVRLILSGLRDLQKSEHIFFFEKVYICPLQRKKVPGV
jgi:hypothetical protein